MCWISRKSMISSTVLRCSTSSASAGPNRNELPQEAAMHLQRTTGHDIVERGHSLEQGDILKRARDAAARGLVGPHVERALPLNVMRPRWG